MSLYTVGEILAWLVATAVLGFGLGWVTHSLRTRLSRRDMSILLRGQLDAANTEIAALKERLTDLQRS